jgi:glycosyltransferase involved in cell wall biosynthesis
LRLDRGDRLRAYHAARLFRDAGFAVEVCAFAARGESAAAPGPLEGIAERVSVVERPPVAAAIAAARGLAGRKPLQVAYYASRAMERLVAEAASRRPHVVFAHLFRMAPFALSVPGVCRVLDLCDAIGGELERSLPHRRGFDRVLYAIETPRVRRYEVEVAKHFDEVWVASGRDRDDLESRGGPPGMRVVPNGVEIARPVPGVRPLPGRILFVGHLGVPHNADAVRFFATRVVPLIRREEPRAEFVAVGTGAGPALRRLEARGLVRLPGFLPDLDRALQEASVFVAPLRFAAGLQNKVLEAMAAGRPVVASPQVNAGIGAQPNRDIVLASEAGSLAAETLGLLRDPQRGARMGESAREFVAERYTWEALALRASSLAEHCGRRGGGRRGKSA